MRLEQFPKALHEPLLRWQERLGAQSESVAAALSEEATRAAAASDFVASSVLYDPSLLAQLASPNAFPVPSVIAPPEAASPGIALPLSSARGAAPADLAAFNDALRVWRRAELARIAYRDILGLAAVPETLASLSAAADAAIHAAVAAAEHELAPVFGVPLAARDDAEPPAQDAASAGAKSSHRAVLAGSVLAGAADRSHFIVLGMGKLGGRELNFSSDIDLIFLYTEPGETTGPRVVDNGEYFNRLGQEVIRLLDAKTDQGFVFRVDMRLRPFGQSGPLVVSEAALEDYLQQHGRDWERYAWIKARAIVGADHYFELYANYVRPFVYRRYLDFGVFESLRDMKAMIEREVSRRDLQNHLKLGRGGIREIEFIVQSFQLVRGGSDRRLQNPSLLQVLPLLAGAKLLRESAVAELQQAYLILRKAENAVQMMRDAQVHTMPESEIDRDRLALILGEADWPAAQALIDAAREKVAYHFDALVFGATDASRAGADGGRTAADGPHAGGSNAGDAARGAATRASGTTALTWFDSDGANFEEELLQAGFAAGEAPAAATALRTYRNSGNYRRLDETGHRRVRSLLARLLKRAGASAAPAVTLQRVLRVIEAIGSRAAYLALLNEHSAALDRLVDICGISGFLTTQIAEFPLLLDELLDSRLFEELPSREGFAAELAARVERMPIDDPERQIEALRGFQKAAFFAVALADLTGRLPLMKVSDRLTDVAELIIDRCMQLGWLQMKAVYGEPRCGNDESALRAVHITTAAYGKLGGLELGYGSDLDLVFLHDSSGEIQQTSGQKPIDNGVFFLRLGQRIVHLLTFHSAAGRLYEVDMRLRPNGKGGFLITGIDAFDRYQREEAWTWEHQALLRARAVAGDAGLRERFEAVRRRALLDDIHRDTLREDVAQMRARMRQELSKAKASGEFDIKQDAGGIADIEFLVQYWVLAHAREHPDLIEFPDNIRQLEALARDGLMSDATAAWMADAYRNYRSVLHLLTLEGDGDRVVDEAPHAATRARVIEIWRETFGA